MASLRDKPSLVTSLGSFAQAGFRHINLFMLENGVMKINNDGVFVS